MVTPELSRFQALNSMPPPLKPFEDELVDETMPAPPQGIDAATKRYTGSDAAEHEEMSVVRFAEESARSLFSPSSPAARAAMRELQEGGFAIIEDRQAVLEGGGGEALPAIRGGAKLGTVTHLRFCVSWPDALVRASHIEARGAAEALLKLRQLPIALNEDGWCAAKGKRQKAVASQSFQGCRWFVRGEVILWQDAGSADVSAFQAQAMLALDPPENAEGDEPCEQACPPERRMIALLYLNTPAWRPDWGGALRCHLGSVSRDVWGDGGRLVLLREDRSYELLPSGRQQTVLMMRLEGMLVQPDPTIQDRSRTGF
eukprot:s249_g4.t1